MDDQADTYTVVHDSAAVEDDSSLSVDQAAAHFNVSERTIHRRIKQGQIQARKVDTPRGQVWRVYVDSSAVVDDSNAGKHDSRPSAAESTEMIRLVDRLSRENTQLAGQVGYLQRQVQEQQETIQRLLMAPKDEPISTMVETPEAEQPRRSWWQRLRGRYGRH